MNLMDVHLRDMYMHCCHARTAIDGDPARESAAVFKDRAIRRAVSVTILAALAAGFGIATSGPAYALGAGRVCMFNATEGALTAGHVGWAFRVGSADQWIYGATENASWNWQQQSNWAGVIATFEVTNGASYYDHYRCENTGGSAVTAAKNKVNEVYGRPYNVAWDNCLTRSVEIFKAYDSSLNNLPDAAFIGPNWYYDNDLVGFEPRTYL
jgi:hypothetical protein